MLYTTLAKTVAIPIFVVLLQPFSYQQIAYLTDLIVNLLLNSKCFTFTTIFFNYCCIPMTYIIKMLIYKIEFLYGTRPKFIFMEIQNFSFRFLFFRSTITRTKLQISSNCNLNLFHVYSYYLFEEVDELVDVS